MTNNADALYSGGPILTIDRQQPEVEAVAVRDGRILAMGSVQELERHAGPPGQRESIAIDLRVTPLIGDDGFALDGYGADQEQHLH